MLSKVREFQSVGFAKSIFAFSIVLFSSLQLQLLFLFMRKRLLLTSPSSWALLLRLQVLKFSKCFFWLRGAPERKVACSAEMPESVADEYWRAAHGRRMNVGDVLAKRGRFHGRNKMFRATSPLHWEISITGCKKQRELGQMCFPQIHFLSKITSKKKSVFAAKQNDALQKKSYVKGIF